MNNIKTTKYIPQRYKYDDEIFKQLEEYYTTGKQFNRWYCIAPKTFVYYNERGYYHIVKMTKISASGKISLDDYIVKDNGSLKYANKSYEFNSKAEFETFLIEKHGFKNEEE